LNLIKDNKNFGKKIIEYNFLKSSPKKLKSEYNLSIIFLYNLAFFLSKDLDLISSNVFNILFPSVNTFKRIQKIFFENKIFFYFFYIF
jgi:hypothetical protein